MTINIEEGNLKQFKLVDGDEIVCEVLEDLEDDIIIRYALKIVKVDISLGSAYYIFKNWMTFQEKTTDTVALSKFHIMGMAVPTEVLLKEYYSAVESINSYQDESTTEKDVIYDLLEKLGLATTKPLSGDSSGANVISFIDRTKLH